MSDSAGGEERPPSGGSPPSPPGGPAGTSATIRTARSSPSPRRRARGTQGGGDGARPEVVDGSGAGPQQNRGQIGDDLVDQASRQEGGGQPRPAFEQHVADLLAGQDRQDRARIMVGHQQVPVVDEHPCALGHRPASDDDAQRLKGARQRPVVLVEHGQGGIVGQDGAGAHHDGVALAAQAVGIATCDRRGDPSAGGIGGGHAPVQARRQLPGHQWPSAGHSEGPRAIEALGLPTAQPGAHSHAGLSQPRRSTRGERIGVVLGVNDLGDAGVEERSGARPGASSVVAGLESDDGDGASRALAGAGQRVDLGMGGARPPVVPFGQDAPLGAHDDAADPRIGTGRGIG